MRQPNPTADLVINGAWIVPVVPTNTVLADHALVIGNQRILALAPQPRIARQFPDVPTVVLDRHVLIPGLVNAHGHAAMTLLRGIADDMPLQPWLEDRIWPLESRYLSREFVRDGTRLAMAEMISGGTTCCADMYFFPDEVARICLESRMRVQLASPVLDFPTAWAPHADACLSKATRLHDDYRHSDLVFTAFGPHAPYSVSDEALQKTGSLAHELDIPVHIHLHETAQEISDALARDGKRPLQRLLDLHLVGPQLVNVHATQLVPQEIQLLARQGASVVHCPSSNLKLASGLCEVENLRQAGVNVALGTDGAASNNGLDLLAEMRLAALLAKGVAHDARALPAAAALAMATINGARALGLEAELGSLEPGKFADITAVNLDSVNTLPLNDVISHLVYAVQAHQVSDVWCGGHALKRQGELRTLDLAYIRQRGHYWQRTFQQDQNKAGERGS